MHRVRDNVYLEIRLNVLRSFERAIIVVNVLDEQMEVLSSIISTDSDFNIALNSGVHTIRCDIGTLPLVPGYYRLSIGIAESYGVLAWDVLEPLRLWDRVKR